MRALVLLIACGPIYQSPPPPPQTSRTDAPDPSGRWGGARDPDPEVRERSRGPEATQPSGAPPAMVAIVRAHNEVRAKHCAGPLSWSPKLAAVAQDWASSLKTQGCKLRHKPANTFGENLAAGTSGMLDGGAVASMWYDEVKHYQFPTGGFSMQTGHFTQVVWRQTTQIGCAVTACNGIDIWVCEYDPPGNVDTLYQQNVLPRNCG